MAKLYFYYSAMNAGKTTALLQSAHNYKERNMEVLLLKPSIDQRFGPGRLVSRIGIEKSAIEFRPSTNLLTLFQELNRPNLACIFVDEAQFLCKAQVAELAQIVDQQRIPILCYGIRTDFLGNLFEGSQYLLAWADKIIELKTICICGKKATMNLRLDKNKEKIQTGDQIELAGNERYLSVCRKHFYHWHPDLLNKEKT